jgi:hypothetical protein
MNRYDPNHAPNPEQWLALDEQERILLVEKQHRAARIKLPNAKGHAIFHAIVENQIAEGLDSVVRAMTRLAGQGLSRHEAIHAITSVLAGQIHGLLGGEIDEAHSTAVYNAAVERLTAKDWLQS